MERDYPLTFRLSSPSGGQFLEMTIDGRSEVTVIAPRTGSSDAYATISTQVRLTKGTHRVRVQFFGDGQNFDAFGLSLRRHPGPPFRFIYHHAGGSVSA